MRCTNTTASQARKRLPPTDPEDFTPRWRSERPSRQRSVPELCRPGLSFDTGSQRSFCVLDAPGRDYSSKLDEPHAVYGILQLKAICEHTHDHSKP